MTESLVRRVAKAVCERGTATWRDISPEFPGLSGDRLGKCFRQAAGHGWVRLERPSGAGRNADPALWRGVSVPRTGAPKLPRVSCVWDLASGRTVKVPQGKGRRFQPLGEW